MKKLHYVLALFLICTVSHAGLITHTDYTAGSVITAAGQNSNENTIVNEINGSLNSANIATNGIQTTNITDGNVTLAKLATVVQSSITIGVNLASYRRPTLLYSSVSKVNIETETNGVSGQATVLFPDGTLRHDSDSSHYQVDITRNAQFISGTIQSGLRTGSASANTWYAVYAVKSQANSSDFVGVFDTLMPNQVNLSALNTAYGVNSWVYIGVIAYGNNRDATTSIVSFIQNGNITLFTNTTAMTGIGSFVGVKLSSATATTSITYTYAQGSSVAGQIPAHLGMGKYAGARNYDFSDRGAQWTDSTQNILFGYDFDGAISHSSVSTFWMPLSLGLSGLDYNSTSGHVWAVFLQGFTDNVLGVGSNPLF